MQAQAVFSEGQDESKLAEETKELIEEGWEMDEERRGVKRQYFFKTYTKALVRLAPLLPPRRGTGLAN